MILSTQTVEGEMGDIIGALSRMFPSPLLFLSQLCELFASLLIHIYVVVVPFLFGRLSVGDLQLYFLHVGLFYVTFVRCLHLNFRSWSVKDLDAVV